MSASRKLATQMWTFSGLLLACSSMQNLGEKATNDRVPGDHGATGGGNGPGPGDGGTTTTDIVGGTSGDGGFVTHAGESGAYPAGGGSTSPSSGGEAGRAEGGRGIIVTPPIAGGSRGTWIDGECWGTPEETNTLSACPATYCEVRAQMVGYCGTYAHDRRPPIVRYAFQRSCGNVKDVNISVDPYGYSCRYASNALVGVMEYVDADFYCAGRSTNIQSGVHLTDCSTNRVTFCDARLGSGGAAGSAAFGAAGASSQIFPAAGAAGRSAVGVGGAMGSAGAAHSAGASGAAGTTGTTSIGLCYDAATDTCQPC